MGAQGQIDGAVGQVGQRAGHLLQRPDAAQIGQRRQQRHPPLGAAQRHAQGIRVQRLQARRLAHDDVVMVQRIGQPSASDRSRPAR